MANRSPSVRLLERDLSTYTVTESNTVLAIVGYAAYGPIMEPRTTTSLKEFQDLFGEGASNSPWSYLGAYRAFNQTNKIIFMRVADETQAVEAEKNIRTFERGQDGSIKYDTNQFISLDSATQQNTYFAFTVNGADGYITTDATSSLSVDDLVSKLNTAAGDTVGFSVLGDSFTSVTSTSNLTSGTTYAFDLTVDGGTVSPISFTASGTTIDDLITDLETELSGEGVSVSFDNKARGIKIESTGITGAGSSVLVEAPATGDDLLTALGGGTTVSIAQVDGRAAITGVTFENESGDLKVSLENSDLTTIANATPILGTNIEDSSDGLLDVSSAITEDFVAAESQDDGYMINFKALYSGTYGKNIQVQKTSLVNDFDGSTIHNIDILFKGDTVESYNDVSLDSTHDRYFVSLINESQDNGGSSLLTVELTEPTAPTGTVIPFEDGLYTLGASDWDYEVSYESNATEYDFRTGNDGVPSTVQDERVLFLEALSTSADSPMMNTEAYDYHVLTTPDTQDSAIQDAALTLANSEGRKDFIYIVDPPMGLKYNEVKDWHNGKSVDRTGALNSSYGAMYWSWQKDVNPVDGRIIDVPPSVFVAEKYLEVDNNFGPWYPPAGDARGGIVSQGYEASPSFPQRNELYANSNAVNPIVDFVGKGLIIYGQKTLLRQNSSLNRVHVRRMIIYIKKLMRAALQGFLFELNNPDSYRRAENSVNAILAPIRRAGGIERASVEFSDQTTPAELRAQNVMRGVVKIVPVNSIEAIDVSIVLLNPGASVE